MSDRRRAYSRRSGAITRAAHLAPPSDPQQVMAALESEREFQRWVIELATLCGWMTYHTHDSRRSQPGYPDLTLLRGKRLLFIELKTEMGALRPEQREWQAALLTIAEASGGVLSYYTWRPSDRQTIAEVLA